MKNRFLEAGQIANTHGLTGEVKIVPWCDSPEFLCDFDTIYIDGNPVKIKSTRIHKNNVLAYLEGVDDVNAAMRLKGKTIHIDRTGVVLPDGRHFIVDMLGLDVIDVNTDTTIGKLVEVLTPPAHQVYLVKGEKTYMIPAVDAFLVETNIEAGYVKIRLIDGLEV